VSGPTSGSRSTALTFSANAIGGSGSYTYSWACQYNPLAGTSQFAPGQATSTCSYPNAGTYTVVARATDTAFSSGYSLGNTVTITGGLPAPSSASTLSGPSLTINQFNGRYASASGSPVTFTATETDANASSFTWDFGDGTPTGSGRVATHSYATSGSYPARLTVAGNNTTTAGTASSTINIDISGPPAPSAAYTLDGATATGTDAYDIEAQKQVVATATETKASKYDWDFGDGTTANGKVVVHAWSTPGARTLKLTVTGNGTDTGGSRSVNIAMNVTPVKFKAMIVPGAAHLDLGASVWGTDVSVSNPGADTVTITPNFVAYADGGGDNLDISQLTYDPSLSFQLAPGASWSKVDVVKFLNGGSNKGTLIFKFEGSADPVVTARVYFASASDPQGPSYGAAFPSYKVTGSGGVSTSAAEEVSATGDQTLIGLRSDSLYRFRVTLFNADSKAGTFRLTAYDQANNRQLMKDATGALVGFREFRIGPYQQASPNDVDLGLTNASMRYVLKGSRSERLSTARRATSSRSPTTRLPRWRSPASSPTTWRE
jgi:PKD repeat protein